jgi:hypothetical protein
MASADNLPQGHEQTYNGFTNLLKWVVPITVVLTLIVILLIS